MLSLLCLTTSGSAWAAVFNVAAGDTAGLIAAITTANGNGVANVINLGGGTYNLTVADNTSVIAGPNGLPAITSTLTINGNGSTIARTGAPLFRILQVGSATGTVGALTLNNAIITGGNPGQTPGPQAPTDGGGIVVFAANSSLTVNGSTISGNTSRGGGGISIEGTAASAVITNSTVSSNTASSTTGGFGGGIAVEGFTSRLTVTNSNVLNNVAAGATGGAVGAAGGAISVDGGANVINITNSTLSGNQANGGTAGAEGGAIEESGGNSSVYVITGTTISNNSVNATTGNARGAGFMASADATVTFRNSTISGNSLSTGSATVQGGAIANTGGSVFVLSNTTVTNNSAKTGGGLFQTGAGSITLRNSILAGNAASTTGPDCNGTIASQGHNLIGSTVGCTFAASTGDLLGASANLGPLANNGGPTQTHALNVGSVAIDAGDSGVPGSGGTACEATDQRGVTRPQGVRCDIGAFEVSGAPPPPPPPPVATVVPTLSEWAIYALSALLGLFGIVGIRLRGR
ncbi:MAG: IPTL-CTERM sorting domain-containing protein [Pseudomonadota bacterium]|nr:IPTL-CTERM sorting domain-containing protein [Pseudomonadota bacterium]